MQRCIFKHHFSILLFFIVLLQWIPLECSYSVLWYVPFKNPAVILLNLIMILFINLLFVVFWGRWFYGLMFSNALICVLGIVNSYVYLFHGSPLCLSEIMSAGTAMEVLSAYDFSITLRSLISILFFIADYILIRQLRKIERNRSVREVFVAISLCFIFIYLSLYGPMPIKPDNAISWSWQEAGHKYGYLPCLLEDAERTLNPLPAPEGYSTAEFDSIVKQSETTSNIDSQYPDIIFILNETFYNLDIYSEIAASENYLNSYNSIDNGLKGYTVVPSDGGGTNHSEYELLTSNSAKLLHNGAPFFFLDFTNANSIVSYLESFGYETLAMHQQASGNYARGKVYPLLGFDKSLFKPDFQTDDSYGNRRYTDVANYKDLATVYESMSDSPRFIYLLTYQNHGGYEQNDSSYDIVYTLKDFGSHTDDVNEFLSTMELSDSALENLFEYFSSIDRRVIICFAGDHSPSFTKNLPAKNDVVESNAFLYRRMTPFFIWANYDIDDCENLHKTLTDLAPMTLKVAGIPLSPYYDYILELSKDYPVRTSNGTYWDSYGNSYNYNPLESDSAKLSLYYNMEYNNISKGSDYVSELFEAP